MPTAQVEINGRIATIEYPEGMSSDEVTKKVKQWHAGTAKRIVQNVYPEAKEQEQPMAIPQEQGGLGQTMKDYITEGVDVGPFNVPSPVSPMISGVTSIPEQVKKLPEVARKATAFGEGVSRQFPVPGTGVAMDALKGLMSKIGLEAPDVSVKEKHPTAAALGEMAPDLARSVAAYEVGAKMFPQLQAANIAQLKEAGKGTKLARILNIAKGGGRGAIGNVAAGQMSRRGSADPWDVVEDVGWGAALGLGGAAASEGLGVARAAKENIKTRLMEAIETRYGPERSKELVRRLPVVGKWINEVFSGGGKIKADKAKEAFKATEKARRTTFAAQEDAKREVYRTAKLAKQEAHAAAKQHSIEQGKKLMPKRPEEVGKTFKDVVDKTHDEMIANVAKSVNPTVEKYASQKISAEPVRKNIVKVMKKYGMTDDAGNILYDKISTVKAPEMKRMLSTLAEYSDDLAKNPTVRDINRISKEMQSMSKFGALERSEEARVFGELSYSTKQSLYDGLEGIASGSEVQAIKSSRKAFSESKGMIDEMRKVADAAPEIVASKGIRIAPSTMDDLWVKQPTMRDSITDMVVLDLSTGAKNAKSFGRAIEKYGRKRLQKLLPKDLYDDVMRVEKKMYKTHRKMAPMPRYKAGKFEPGQMPKEELGELWKRLNNYLKKSAGKTKEPSKIGRILKKVPPAAVYARPKEKKGGE